MKPHQSTDLRRTNLKAVPFTVCQFAWALLITITMAGQSFGAVLPPGVTLYAAAFGGGTFVGVGNDGAIFSSTGGGPWGQRASGVTNRLEAVIFANGMFLAAGDNGTLLSSSNGVSWTSHGINVVQTSPRIAYGNGRFVVGGKGASGQWMMLISSNAVDWSTVAVEAPGPDSLPDGMPFGGISFGAGRFLAVGGAPGGAALFLTSTNGINWKEQGSTSPTSAAFGPITFGQGRFALVENYFYEDDDDDSGFFDRLLLSEDGISWQPSYPWNTDYKAVVIGDCRVVVAGDNPAGSYAKVAVFDGTDYGTILDAPVIDVVNALVYGNNKYLAVGSDIVELPVPTTSPLISLQQTNYVVVPNPYSYAYFSAGFACLDPPITYQWQHNGSNIPGATNRSLVIGPNLTTNDAGSYRMLASNALGQTATSVVATVTMQLPVEVPAGVSWPTSDYFPTVLLGSDTSLNVGTTGWPTPTYQWRFNGTNLPGETNYFLPLFNVPAAARGDYTLFVSNALGSATSPHFLLSVTQYPLSFYVYTQSFSVIEGSRLPFAFPLYGPLFYPYWLPLSELHIVKDGVGQRLSLTRDLNIILREVSRSDAGSYTLVASNALGLATAFVANVSVTPAGPLDRWTQRNPLPQSDTLFDSAYGAGRFVGVGDRGSIVLSTNRVDWTSVHLKSETLLSGIAFGNGRFVAVGGPNILASPDGQEWTTRMVRFDLALESVVFGNGRFVAAGGDGMLTSTDGLSWVDAILPSAGARGFRQVAFGNGIYVAVGYNAESPSIWRSVNGVTWFPLLTGPRDELEGVTFGNGQFVAVGNDGIIYTSTDGMAWTARDSTVSTRLLGAAFGNGRYVAVGARGRVLSSANGVTWTKETSGTPDRLESVRFVNDFFVAMGENGTILTSSSGAAWTRQNRGTTRDLDDVATGAGLIVVAGKNGLILTSTNGIQFTPSDTGVTNDLHGVSWADGLFVAVGEPEIIITSSNAINWQTRHAGTSSSLKRVRRGGNLWVAVGTQGTILTSPDAVIWTPRNSATANDLNDVSYGEGRFVVVGDNLPPNGTMLISTDGVNWSRRHRYIGKNLRSVNYANGTFIATANDETFTISSNGVDWQTRTMSVYPIDGNNLRAVTYAAGTWIMVGNQGLVYTSTDTTNWTRRPSPTLENLHGVVLWGERLVTIGNRGTILQSGSLAPPPSVAGRFQAGGFELSVYGQVGTLYELQAANSLSALDWTPITTFTLAQPATNFIDAASLTNSQRYYRVVSP